MRHFAGSSTDGNKAHIDRRSVRTPNGQAHVLSVTLVGLAKVGKSTLVRRLVRRVFEETYTPTMEQEYSIQIDIDRSPVTLCIVDRGSRAPFREQAFDGILLVYSLKDRRSFEFIQQTGEAFDSRYQGVVLVGTHSDCKSEERAVASHEGAALASRFGIGYVETSAYSPRCTEAFYILARVMRSIKDPAHQLEILRQDAQTGILGSEFDTAPSTLISSPLSPRSSRIRNSLPARKEGSFKALWKRMTEKEI